MRVELFVNEINNWGGSGASLFLDPDGGLVTMG